MDEGFRLLVIADVHYDSAEKAAEFRMGCELLDRAIWSARRRGGFDAVALMGDLINDGRSDRAEDDLRALAMAVDSAIGEKPLLVIPGNHDSDPDRLMRIFGGLPGLRKIGGYCFATFVDSYRDDIYCTCDQQAREQLLLADQIPEPLIVLQHNPIWPDLDCSEYPFLPVNVEWVRKCYQQAGVLLSLSGHYHPGQPLCSSGDVQYFVAPALYHPPYPYAVVTIRARDVSVEMCNIGDQL